MAFEVYKVVRFTVDGRNYDVDERLIDMDRTAPSRTDPKV